MSNQSCSEINNSNNEVKKRGPIVGASVVSPISNKDENCDKYMNVLRRYGGYTSYTGAAIDNVEMQNELDIQLSNSIFTRGGVYLNPLLISSVRRTITRNSSLRNGSMPSDDEVCKSFESEKNKLPLRSTISYTTPHIPSDLQRRIQEGTRIRDSKQEGIYWTSIALILRNSGYDQYFDSLLTKKRTLACSTEVLSHIDAERSLWKEDAVIREAVLAKNSYDKVSGVITGYLNDLSVAKKSNRLLPVKANVLDKNGNPTPQTYLTFLEGPKDLDLTKIQSLPPDQKQAALLRVYNESKPIPGPFDPERLEAAGVTETDTENYNNIVKKMEYVSSDPNLMSSFFTYTQNNIYTQRVLKGETKETLDRIKRIQENRPTKQDIEEITNGGFAKSINELANSPEIKNNPSITKKLLKTTNKIFTGPTPYVGSYEISYHKIHHQVVADIQEQLSEASSRSQVNSIISKNKIKGVEQIPPRPGNVKKSEWYRRQSGLVSAAKEEIKDGLASRVMVTEHNIGTAMGIAASLYYGYNTFKSARNYVNAYVSGDKDAIVSAEIDTTKYAALTTLEVLVTIGVVSPGPGTAIAATIYLGAMGAESAKKSDDENRDRALAAYSGNVPSAYIKGIIIPRPEVIASISQLNDDPSDDLFVHRPDKYPPYSKTITLPGSYWSTDKYGLIKDAVKSVISLPLGPIGVALSIDGPEDITGTVPIIPAWTGVTIVTGSIKPISEMTNEEKRNYHRCKCCGPCNTQQELLDVTTSPGGLSVECEQIFKSYASEQRRIFPQESSGKDEVELGIDYLCNFAGGCFTSDVKVLTPYGEKQIIDFNIGDSVVAFDNDGNLVNSIVTEKFVHYNKIVNEYRFDNGIIINSTPNHPFYTKNGFVEIGNLSIGDGVIGKDGNEIKLISVTKKSNDTVYNIEVDTHHTYIANQIRVHNKFDPNVRFQELKGRAPEPQPRHETNNSWPEISSGNGWEIERTRISVSENCKSRRTNPLMPNSGRGKGDWFCKFSINYAPVVDVSLGPLGVDLSSEFSRDRDVVTMGGYNVPTTIDLNELELPKPPYTYNPNPGNPYFDWTESSMNRYLKSYPYYLTNSEIELVKGGDLVKIRDYFSGDGKDPKDKENLKGYYLTIISAKYTMLKEKEERNIKERKLYLDCINSSLG